MHGPHLTFSKFVSILINVLVKFSDSMLSVNLEYLSQKMKCRILSVSSPAEIKLLPPALTALEGPGNYMLWLKLDSRSYIRFVPTIMITMNI